ncbi:NrfD/PsrC family molybdoenzyme membrane anchor subunit [Chloroflexota bacterium]
MNAWAPPIWIYLWMAGMAGGAYFAAFLAERFSGIKDRKLLRLASYVGVPLAVIGVLLLVVDLGSPLRFWHLFTEFKMSSPMSMGTWILLAWIIIAVICMVLWWIGNKITEPTASSLRKLTGLLSAANVPLAVLLIAYTGVLLAVSNQSLWSGTALLPALFVTSAVSTGVALLILAALAANAISKGKLAEMRMALNYLFGDTDWTISSKTVARLAEADVIVIVLELVTLVGYTIWLGVSSVAGTGDAIGMLTTGVMAAPFWVGVVLLALLIPLGIEIANWGKEIESKGVVRAVITSSTCVILGGLVLRAVITIGGQ